MNNCAICGQPMKWINAGVSKATGKPYNSFWACNDRTHKQPKAPQTAYMPLQPIYQPQQAYQPPTPQILPKTGYVAPTKQPNWDAISYGKCKHAFLVEAYKLGKDPDVAEADAEDWATRSMRKLGKIEMKDFGNGETLDQIPF